MAWDKKPTDFMDVVNDGLLKTVNQMTAEALGAVIRGSPVDSGSYRMNHRVSFGSPDGGADPDAGRGQDVEPERGADTGIPAYESGMRLITTNRDPLTVAYVQNNLKYAGVIEFGRPSGKPGSKQAPEGVYQVAAIALREKYGS